MNTQLLDHIYIVLVNTSLTLNIGAAARAMHTMGLKNLVLVDPRQTIDDHAYAVAAGGHALLKSARICSSLEESVAPMQLIVATSSRMRTIAWPLLDLRPAAETILKELQQTATHNPHYACAIVFGREDRGLTNTELSLAHYHLTIPANPLYPVLNLASAVQLVAYELWMAAHITQLPALDDSIISPTADATDYDVSTRVTAAAMEEFYDHFETMLHHIDFLDPKNPRLLPLRIRRLFNRIRLDNVEYNLLRGIIGKVLHLTGGTWQPNKTALPTTPSTLTDTPPLNLK